MPSFISKVIAKVLRKMGATDFLIRELKKENTYQEIYVELEKRLQSLEAKVPQHENDLRKEILLGRSANLKILASSLEHNPPKRKENPLELKAALEELKSRVPEWFVIWQELFENARKGYIADPLSSCSVEHHAWAGYFASFLRSHLSGWVLDIGCGPQPVPSYLDGYPTELICGIDPLPPSGAPHPFTFEQAICEHLPWQDNSFDTVILATSLDHVLLLDRALDEIKRVMRPTGRLVLWVAFLPGEKPYDPYTQIPKARDQFHLFHFDKEWFESTMNEKFTLLESFSFRWPELSAFYCYQPKITQS